LIIVSIIVIYIKDEKLTIEAQTFYYEMTPEEIQPNENNFYYFLGFDYNSKNNSFEKVENYVKALEKRDYSITNGYFYSEDISAMDVLHNKDIFPSERNYLEFVSQNSTLIDSLWSIYGKLENEYFNISSHQAFQSLLNFRYGKETHPYFMNYDLLKNAHLALQYINGDKNKVISDISKQLVHIRKLMKQADTAESKINFLIIFERNLELIDKLLDSNNQNNNGLEIIIQNIKPISLSERDFTNCVRKDFLHDIQVIEDKTQKDYIGYRGFFWRIYFSITTSKNKFINRNLQTFKYIIKLSKLSTSQFFNEKKNIEDNYLGNRDYEFFTAQNFYGQWIDKTFLNYTFIDLYHNVDSYIILLKLKMMIYKNNVKKENIQLFLKMNKEEFQNPYNEDMIKWDSEKSILYIGDEYIEDWNSLGRVELRL